MQYSPFRHIGSIFRKNRPIHLTLFLTRRCNSACPFCFYLSETGLSGDARNELTLDEIRRISGSAGDLLWLAFSGGEIFLRDDIAEIAGVFYDRNRPAIMLFPTNGLMTDVIRDKVETVLKHCPRSTVVVKLSLDGTEELHDEIRGKKGGFKRMMKTYEALGGLLDVYPNFELGINTVFCSLNQEHMTEIISYVKGLGKITTHTISLIRGAVSEKGMKDVDPAKYFDAVNLLASNLREKSAAVYRFRGARLKAAQDVLQRRLIYETTVRNKRMLPCFAGRLNLVLTENGDVYPCESFTKKMGNVREKGYDIPGILGSAEAREVVGHIRKTGCFCTHECYFMTNIMFNLMMYPALLKEYMLLK